MSIATSALAPLDDQWNEPRGWAWRGPRRHLAVVPEEPREADFGGIWSDPRFTVEATELTSALRGLALLEAEVLSI